MLLTPYRTDAAPQNAKVQLEVPEPQSVSVAVVFRVVGGADVQVTSQKMTYDVTSVVERGTGGLLLPSKQFEVGTADITRHPATTIVEAITTGTSTDKDGLKDRQAVGVWKGNAAWAVAPVQCPGLGWRSKGFRRATDKRADPSIQVRAAATWARNPRSK